MTFVRIQRSPRFGTEVAAGCLALASLIPLSGCAPSITGTFVPNQRPTIRMSQAPASSTVQYFYSYRMEWFAYDPDGTVSFSEYSVDPAPGDTTWTRTEDHDVTILFRSDEPDPSGTSGAARGFHVFVIRAVDNDGAASEPAVRAFFTRTVAPTVQLTTPFPNAFLPASLGPAVELHWTGTDPDGVTTSRPVKYKYVLLTSSSAFPQDLAISDPDSLRSYYAPLFAGWDSTSGDAPVARYSSLAPGASYVFAAVAFDEAGAYSPVFSFTTNMLRFKVGVATTLGPRITLYNTYFSYTYPSGGWSLDPRVQVPFDALPYTTLTFNWTAAAGQGATLRSFRWRLDGDVDDETPRTDPTDVYHWSDPGLLNDHATIGPFPPGEVHRLYVEASDNLGFRSLGIVKIQVLGGAFERDLLIVDDTRFLVDSRAMGGCIRPPIGVWPTASELDTFLYARGGVQYKCLPAGVLSNPGLFTGYDFDTLGTQDAPFSFTTLSRYRHVIWMVDAISALNNGRNDRVALRVMNSIGVINSLAAYAEQGGHLWLLGGGVGYASMINFDVASNNGTTTTFSQSAGELIPGRFFHDATGWRSEFKVARTSAIMARSDRAVADSPWAPDYSQLPMAISAKSTFTDPLPPTRAGQSLGLYYRTLFDFEYLSQANRVLELVPALGADTLSTLDTLYRAVGPGVPGPAQNPENVVMTYYARPGKTPVILTGFDIWTFRKAQCVQLVDFVLQRVWGLTKQP